MLIVGMDDSLSSVRVRMYLSLRVHNVMVEHDNVSEGVSMGVSA